MSFTWQKKAFEQSFFGALLWFSAILITLALYGLNVFFGELNQDEGWYLYGASLLLRGELPYIDFATTQGPVMYFVYTFVSPCVSLFGVIAGRVFTALLGVLAVWSFVRVVRRFVSPLFADLAGFIVFCLIAVNVYQSYFTSIVKTYALTSLFISYAFLCLSSERQQRNALRLIGAGVFIGLAAGVRITALAILPVVVLVMIVGRKKADEQYGRCAWAWLCLGAGIVMAIIFLPFLIKAPRALWFALIEYHTGRESGSPLLALAYKLGFLSRNIRAYFPAFLLLILYGSMFFLRKTGEKKHNFVLHILCWSFLAVTVAHLMAPFPYDDYQVMIYPVGVAALVLLLFALINDDVEEKWGKIILRYNNVIKSAVLLVCIAHSFSSSINESWFIATRDRIWWPVKKETSLQNLKRASDVVKSLAGESNTILTQDPYLAVEAGFLLPQGLELGPFSYFPDWEYSKASACKVLNKEMMICLLRSGVANVVAFSEYGLSIKAPQIKELTIEEQRELWDILSEKYEFHSEIEAFGQAGTKLRVFVKRNDERA